MNKDEELNDLLQTVKANSIKMKKTHNYHYELIRKVFFEELGEERLKHIRESGAEGIIKFLQLLAELPKDLQDILRRRLLTEVATKINDFYNK